MVPTIEQSQLTSGFPLLWNSITSSFKSMLHLPSFGKMPSTYLIAIGIMVLLILTYIFLRLFVIPKK